MGDFWRNPEFQEALHALRNGTAEFNAAVDEAVARCALAPKESNVDLSFRLHAAIQTLEAEMHRFRERLDDLAEREGGK
jgi:hypothetical protein